MFKLLINVNNVVRVMVNEDPIIFCKVSSKAIPHSTLCNEPRISESTIWVSNSLLKLSFNISSSFVDQVSLLNRLLPFFGVFFNIFLSIKINKCIVDVNNVVSTLHDISTSIVGKNELITAPPQIPITAPQSLLRCFPVIPPCFWFAVNLHLYTSVQSLSSLVAKYITVVHVLGILYAVYVH